MAFANVKPDTIANKIYGQDKISKRHRHRYEFNTKYSDEFAQKGLIFSGESDGGRRMEILEIPSFLRTFFTSDSFIYLFSMDIIFYACVF